MLMMSEGADIFFLPLIWITFLLMRHIHKLNLICHINHSAVTEEQASLVVSHQHTEDALEFEGTLEFEFVQHAEDTQLKKNLISVFRYLTGDYYKYKAIFFSFTYSNGTKTQLKLQQRIFQLDVMKIFTIKLVKL